MLLVMGVCSFCADGMMPVNRRWYRLRMLRRAGATPTDATPTDAVGMEAALVSELCAFAEEV